MARPPAVPRRRPPHKVRVREHHRSRPVGTPSVAAFPPPLAVGDVPMRRGYPFPSVEEWAARAVSPFSNFVGGEEKTLRDRAVDYAGRHVGPPGREGDVSGLDRVAAHEAFEPRRPLTTKLVKPTSSRSGLWRAQ